MVLNGMEEKREKDFLVFAQFQSFSFLSAEQQGEMAEDFLYGQKVSSYMVELLHWVESPGCQGIFFFENL